MFGYRGTGSARGDAVELPGFDADAWAAAAFPRFPLAAIVDEFTLVRRANLALFSGLPKGAMAESREGQRHERVRSGRWRLSWPVTRSTTSKSSSTATAVAIEL